MKKNLFISSLRVFSMFLIILTHIFSANQNIIVQHLSQITNIAVYIFILISGYLYGTLTKIGNKRKWLLNKYYKIILPMFIVFFIYQIYTDNLIDAKNIFYFFNLQILLSENEGLGHLWFVSIIFLCYILVPYIKNKTNMQIKKMIIILFFTQIGLVSFLSILKVNPARVYSLIFFIITFFVGVLLNPDRKCKSENISKTNICILFIIIFGLRFFSTFIFNSQDVLYINMIIPMCNLILCIYTFFFYSFIYNTFLIGKDKKFTFFDDYSYYIFLVHYPLTVKPFSIISNNVLIDFIKVLTLSIFMAIILKCLNKISVKIVRRL